MDPLSNRETLCHTRLLLGVHNEKKIVDALNLCVVSPGEAKPRTLRPSGLEQY